MSILRGEECSEVYIDVTISSLTGNTLLVAGSSFPSLSCCPCLRLVVNSVVSGRHFDA